MVEFDGGGGWGKRMGEEDHRDDWGVRWGRRIGEDEGGGWERRAGEKGRGGGIRFLQWGNCPPFRPQGEEGGLDPEE